MIESRTYKLSLYSNYSCHGPLLEECLQHHGHKGDPRVMLGTCNAIGERA